MKNNTEENDREVCEEGNEDLNQSIHGISKLVSSTSNNGYFETWKKEKLEKIFRTNDKSEIENKKDVKENEENNGNDNEKIEKTNENTKKK